MSLDLNIDEQPSEDTPEDLVDIMKKTEEDFKYGNDSSSNYFFTPKKIIDDYKEFE